MCLFIKDDKNNFELVICEYCLIDNDIYDFFKNMWNCKFNRCIKCKVEYWVKKWLFIWCYNVRVKYIEGDIVIKGDLMYI